MLVAWILGRAAPSFASWRWYIFLESLVESSKCWEIHLSRKFQGKFQVKSLLPTWKNWPAPLKLPFPNNNYHDRVWANVTINVQDTLFFSTCERVFALIKRMFGEQQVAALSDLLSAALMLRYNDRPVG